MTNAAATHAETLGMIAFENGKAPQPGGDKDLMAAVKEFPAFSKEGNALMRAWLKGWHTANLAT